MYDVKSESLMTLDTQACQAEDSLHRAAQLMWENDCGSVPVVDSDRRVIGMITDRDICMAAFTQGGDLHAHPVSSAMSPQVYGCSPDDSVSVAEHLMREQQIRRIPVVNDGRLVGMLSLNDIALGAADPHNDLLFEEVGRTLASICAHRSREAAAAQ